LRRNKNGLLAGDLLEIVDNEDFCKNNIKAVEKKRQKLLRKEFLVWSRKFLIMNIFVKI
jgi:hypothetical protein